MVENWNLTFSSLTFCRDGRNLPETYYLWIITASPLTVACQGLKKKITSLSTALIFSCKTTKVAFDLFARFSQARPQSPLFILRCGKQDRTPTGMGPTAGRNDFLAQAQLSAHMFPPFYLSEEAQLTCCRSASGGLTRGDPQMGR